MGIGNRYLMYYHLFPALFDRFLLNMIAVYIYFSTVIQRDFALMP